MSSIPTKDQLDFLDLELGVFMHYGIRTFNEEHRDWDMKPMSAESFNPSEQDCESWIKQLKDAGVKYTVLTAKHHDGFAIWPSAQTEFCVRNSPYKDGKGDVIREYVDACRKFGMKCGIYYSCAQFDTEQRTGTDYDDFVVAQITELLTNYGKIDYIWFDSCGSDKHKFDEDRIAGTIRSLQPDILVFGPWGRDVRWIGNEWGAAPLENSNNVSDGFLPGECDCCTVRNQWENFWFFNETHKDCVRTPEEMLGMYYHTIGKGSNLLINIGPDRRGLLTESNVKLLAGMVKEMNRRLNDCRVPSSELKSDGEKYVAVLDKFSLIDHIILEENMTDGQHIESFEIFVSETMGEDSAVSVYKGCSVGHRMICTFPTIRAQKIIIKVNGGGKEKFKDFYACYVSGGSQIYQIY